MFKSQSLLRATFFVMAAAILPNPSNAQTINTLEDFNNSLIDYGISWKKPSSLYYPSMYTGFVPRIESANRIHFRLARGNQARLTAPLDELSVLTYLYSLEARVKVTESIIATGHMVPVQQKQVDYFKSVVKSDVYQIPATLAAFKNGQISREEFYERSLNAIKALNPGRVFDINFDLNAVALEWRNGSLRVLAESARASGAQDQPSILAYIGKNPKDSLVAANNLLFGRINAIYLNEGQKEKLSRLVLASLVSPTSDQAFLEQTIAFFNDVTNNRYSFRVIENGQYRPALMCDPSTCTLTYPEFTAVYPNGSVIDWVEDYDGNRIQRIQEVGAMKFVERNYHDVDHIRPEPYYGWVPKMDYTGDGNGIHNPAVRTSLKRDIYKFLYDKMGIPTEHDTLWLVSRSGVSHGCTRMSAGHILEVRQIFPSNPEEMKSVYYTGNNSADYDVFDVNGDGKPEVIGVDYLIAYALVSEDGDGYREANGLREESFKRDEFYARLYGAGQYSFVTGKYVFSNPHISYFSGKPSDQRAKAYNVQLQGEFELYEQAYEKDKLQFFDIPKLKISTLSGDGNNNSNEAHQFVRLFGRVSACGPFANEFPNCYESKFRNELKSLIPAAQY